MKKNNSLSLEKFQVSKIKSGQNILGGTTPDGGSQTGRPTGRRPRSTILGA